MSGWLKWSLLVELFYWVEQRTPWVWPYRWRKWAERQCVAKTGFNIYGERWGGE